MSWNFGSNVRGSCQSAPQRKAEMQKQTLVSIVTQNKASGHDGRGISSAKPGALRGQQVGFRACGPGPMALQLKALQRRPEVFVGEDVRNKQATMKDLVMAVRAS